ncbi:glycosyltransferase family 2 protein [Campylobacter sp. MIT 21-1685]|uniref:glycosyltransferase family 2 protein n=1 Tax=unclassified Campylobacter TaxID=2593542 RepID=UPI00224A9A03|nr:MULTISPECIES: glycosyltransferase family 2 protein [unclassified Campylobacter]MCX2683301.1 glycosyltransferase family 2 protein [Campylobacter sp. MIT 21-1684]MCX2751642.1 glycosyltransferase family 2 protein [Campylobacter sp. MIT 21-1682]MCX2807843.1 glycosyltransferase family 2 protein [Campylobacter sp. MIT 21-1685]
MKKVAIVVPLFNVEPYLEECLESIVNQSYANIEIILVNDGSTDKSLEIAKLYAQKDTRITIIDKVNAGLSSSSRNVSISFLSGEYEFNFQGALENLYSFSVKNDNPYKIIQVLKSQAAFENSIANPVFELSKIDYIEFVDSDDFIELDCVEECLKRMQGCDLLFFSAKAFFEGVKDNKWVSTLEWLGYKSEQIISKDDFLTRIEKTKLHFFYYSWQGMIDFAFLKKTGIRFIDSIIKEDDYFGICLFFSAQSIYVYPRRMYHYRIRKNSLMNYSGDISKQTISPYFQKYLQDFDNDANATKQYLNLSSAVISAKALCIFYNTLQDEYAKEVLKKFLLPSYINEALFILCTAADPLDVMKNLECFKPFLEKESAKRGIDTRVKNEIVYKSGAYVLGLKKFKDFLRAPFVLIKMIRNAKKSQAKMRENCKLYPFVHIPSLKEYSDYAQYLALKKHLSYQLGVAFVSAYRWWFLVPFLPFWILFIVLRFKIQRSKQEETALFLKQSMLLNTKLSSLEWHLYKSARSVSEVGFSLRQFTSSLYNQGLDSSQSALFYQLLVKSRPVCVDFVPKESENLYKHLQERAFVYVFASKTKLLEFFFNNPNFHIQNAALVSKKTKQSLELSTEDGFGLPPHLYFVKQEQNYVYLEDILTSHFAKEERLDFLQLEIHFRNYNVLDELLESSFLDRIDCIVLRIQKIFKESAIFKQYYESKLAIISKILCIGLG